MRVAEHDECFQGEVVCHHGNSNQIQEDEADRPRTGNTASEIGNMFEGRGGGEGVMVCGDGEGVMEGDDDGRPFTAVSHTQHDLRPHPPPQQICGQGS